MPNKIDVKSLYRDLADKEAKRNPKGHHTLGFDDTKIKIGDTEITMCKEGWEALEKMLGTKSPTLMAKRLCAIAVTNES